MTPSRLIRLITAGFAAALLCATNAGAQNAQPIRLIVGYSAGGPVDSAARLFAPALAKQLGTQVLVDNRPGVSGALAGGVVSKSEPDGLTLFFAASPTITISPNSIISGSASS